MRKKVTDDNTSDVLRALEELSEKAQESRSAHDREPKKKVHSHRQSPLVNVFKIFAYDVRHLISNVIGIVVVMGLVIVPSMYAWFNIAASWDPYGNTSQLKVAVANEDSGYTSSLTSIPINVGNTVESTLRKSGKLDWQFTSREKAVDGVYSGKYYAAIVIPKNFSSKMMTLFSTKTQRAHIEYYINEKSNAIAPKITQKAAGTVVEQVSHSFTKAIAQVALDVAGDLGKVANSEDGKRYISTVTKQLNTTAGNLEIFSGQLGSYHDLLQAAAGLSNSAHEILSSSLNEVNSHDTGSVRAQLEETVQNVQSLSSAADSTLEAVSQSLKSSRNALESLDSQVDSLINSIDAPASRVEHQADALGGEIKQSAQKYNQLADAFETLKTQVDSSTALSSTAQSRLSARLSAQISTLRQTASNIASIGTHISQISADSATMRTTISQQRTQMKATIAKAENSLDRVKKSFDADVKPQLSSLQSSMERTAQQALEASESVKSTLTQLSDSGKQAKTDVDDVIVAFRDTQNMLKDSAQSIRQLSSELTQSVRSGTSSLKEFTLQDRNAAALAAELSAPVKLKRNAVFAIANYGSQMAAFYTILAIWVGSVFLVAMMKIAVSDEEKARILGFANADEFAAAAGNGFKPQSVLNGAQFGLGFGSLYWGRYLTFLVISLLQSGLLAMGDMWYLRVQHVSVWRFFLVAWLASIVFSSIMYALSLALGAVGKAIAVILMVMQIAGAGGTFPVQLLPSFFQHVYPLLPFPYALTAMHAAIAGSYGNEFWVAMGHFALFLIPTWLVGLVLARPLSRSNFLVEQLRKTGVYGV